MKILAIKLRNLGDTAIWTSSLAGLRASFPKAEITALVPAPWAPLLEHLDSVDHIEPVGTGTFALARKLWQLRRQNFDVALGFHATTSLCRLIPLVGAKKTSLHHHSWKFVPKTSTLSVTRPGNLEDAISRDWQILESLAVLRKPDPTHLVVSEAEASWARQALGKGKFIALLPGASIETKRYPKDLWLTLLDTLRLKPSLGTPIVIADPKLAAEWGLDGICGERQVPLFAKISLRQLVALLSQCELAVGNDSGPIHIAVALGIRTLSLFGPACIGDWHPYSQPRNVAMQIDVTCRPEGPRDQKAFQYCTLTRCSHLSCLRGISPEMVLEKAGEVMLVSGPR